MRQLMAITALCLAIAGCSAPPSRPARSAAPTATVAHDPRTAAALLKIAAVFNHEYDTGDYGPVYDRWDARSQAIITRADYIRRRTDCPSAPQSARVENAAPGPHGAWLVDYGGKLEFNDFYLAYVAAAA